MTGITYGLFVGTSSADLVTTDHNYCIYDDEYELVWFTRIDGFNEFINTDPLAWHLDGNPTPDSIPTELDLESDGVSDALSWRLATYWELADLRDVLAAPEETAPFYFNHSQDHGTYIFGVSNYGPNEYLGYKTTAAEWNADGTVLDYATKTNEEIAGAGYMDYMVVADVTFIDPDPIPEPATMLLLGSGLIGLAGARRKKYKK